MQKIQGRMAITIRRLHWPIVIVTVAILIFTFAGSPYESMGRVLEAITEPTITHTIERMCE